MGNGIGAKYSTGIFISLIFFVAVSAAQAQVSIRPRLLEIATSGSRGKVETTLGMKAVNYRSPQEWAIAVEKKIDHLKASKAPAARNIILETMRAISSQSSPKPTNAITDSSKNLGTLQITQASVSNPTASAKTLRLAMEKTVSSNPKFKETEKDCNEVNCWAYAGDLRCLGTEFFSPRQINGVVRTLAKGAKIYRSKGAHGPSTDFEVIPGKNIRGVTGAMMQAYVSLTPGPLSLAQKFALADKVSRKCGVY